MREFVEEISSRLGLDKGLIERDLLLHQILLDLSNSNFADDFDSNLIDFGFQEADETGFVRDDLILS